jgi:hypothetical protein
MKKEIKNSIIISISTTYKDVNKLGWKIKSQPYISIFLMTQNHLFSPLPPRPSSNHADALPHPDRVDQIPPNSPWSVIPLFLLNSLAPHPSRKPHPLIHSIALVTRLLGTLPPVTSPPGTPRRRLLGRRLRCCQQIGLGEQANLRGASVYEFSRGPQEFLPLLKERRQLLGRRRRCRQ